MISRIRLREIRILTRSDIALGVLDENLSTNKYWKWIFTYNALYYHNHTVHHRYQHQLAVLLETVPCYHGRYSPIEP